MIDLRLADATNDIYLVDKDLVLTSSIGELLRQRLLVTFRTFVGEWYLDTSFGAYDVQFFTNKGITKEIADAYFLDIILSYEEVDEVLSFTSSFNKTTRAYSLIFNVRTIEGDGTFEINFTQADALIQYPESPSIAEVTTCDFIDTEDANNFYILLNIDIPLTIPWD